MGTLDFSRLQSLGERAKNFRNAMDQWYYGESGHQQGPVDDAGFAELVAEGRIDAKTLVWRQGMPGWLPYAQVAAGGWMMAQAQPLTPAMMPPSTSGLAIVSLVLGVIGFVTCILPLGIGAVICGHLALNEISKSQVPMMGRGMALAGLISGYLASLLLLVTIGFFIFGFASTFHFP